MSSYSNQLSSLRLIVCLAILSFISLSLQAEIKALWVTAWDFNTPEKIDETIDFALNNGFSQLLVHVRYRGDALYRPNRIFSDYHNPEPISYLLSDTEFDPLAYVLEKVERTELEVHAWVTVFVVTSGNINQIPRSHVYYTNPEWVTCDFFDNAMAPNSYEGAFLDAGIPEVHNYLIDVFKDIVANYNIQGLHLDYVRYPDSQFGYAPKAKENYYNTSSTLICRTFPDTQEDAPQIDIHTWKEQQITRFVRRCYAEIKSLKPDIIFSSAVVSDVDKAIRNYSQDWLAWVDEGIVDYVYPMAYGYTDEEVQKDIQRYEKVRDKAIIGLRAWREGNRTYSAKDISSKIQIVRENDFVGTAMFSYSGLKLLINSKLQDSLSSKSSPAHSQPNNFIYGYATNVAGDFLPNIYITLNTGAVNYTDSNGFFLFSRLSAGTYWLKAEEGIKVYFFDDIVLESKETVNIENYDITFRP